MGSRIGAGAERRRVRACHRRICWHRLLRPDERVLPAHWYVRAVTRDGRTITGRRLNEDTYTVQLIDTRDELVSLVKEDLREYELIKKSRYAELRREVDPRATGRPGGLPGVIERDSMKPAFASGSVAELLDAVGRAGDLRPAAARRPGAAELADVCGQLQELALQPARPDPHRATRRTSS